MSKTKSKIALLLCLVSLSSFIVSGKEASAADTWRGHWSNETAIPFLNNVTGNTTLKGLVNTAAMDNWNNNTWVIDFYRTSYASNRQIKVDNVDLSSVSWTGKAEGASYNWDGSGHYYVVNIKLNEGKNIMNYSQSKLKGLIAHEFGHAVGLQHRNTSSYLMYPYDTRRQYVPNTNETYSLQLHYAHQK